ncbi:MAG: hypothetical protein JST26_13535 [Bacteroidetes bacterium]|nr:hypothetical protein [Bacteroidota bacterium]
MQFPVYRKYKNNKRFYKIISDAEFEEIQLIGSKKVVSLHKAAILPDKNFIYDLCFDTSVADEITEAEYKTIYDA